MNKIKQLLLITLISSMAIFSSCGDDDDTTATASCLKCTFPEEGEEAFFNEILNAAWVDQCPGDVITDPETGEEMTLTAASIEVSKVLYENPEFFGATCVYVDKN
jgi:hypothetical protein